MKIAIPQWQGRVSPVFDVAGNVLVVEVDSGVEQTRQDVIFDVEAPQARAARLMETGAKEGANVLVCGAISWPLEMAIATAGIEVIPQICGDVTCVLEAFIEGRLDQGAFLMPGCCGRRRRFQGGGNRGGRARGRMGGPFGAGPGGQCVCPSCGYKTLHSPGEPCNQTACPKCGTMMTRG